MHFSAGRPRGSLGLHSPRVRDPRRCDSRRIGPQRTQSQRKNLSEANPSRRTLGDANPGDTTLGDAFLRQKRTDPCIKNAKRLFQPTIRTIRSTALSCKNRITRPPHTEQFVIRPLRKSRLSRNIRYLRLLPRIFRSVRVYCKLRATSFF